jgi:hypothetical protein
MPSLLASLVPLRKTSDFKQNHAAMKNEIIIFQSNELNENIAVRIDEEKETLWLTQEQISKLFGRDRTVISKHFKNIFKEQELNEQVVCAFFAHTIEHGAIKGKTQEKRVKYYNLDAIISIGYRVNSKRGTQFRIWANRVLKDFLMKGYAVNNRVIRLENHLENLEEKVGQIELKLNTQLIPTQGIFFDGQVFDAYAFASRIIRSAEKNIVLIDNYIDESTFTHLSKKKEGVDVRILTKLHSKQIQLDLTKANEQYGGFELKSFHKSHDRFLIIDDQEVYHLGASLKDLGKRWFAFSKLDKASVDGLLTMMK